MNKSISDLIEDFIMSSLDDDDFIELSRNDLAKFFSCVPSQINYVLNTRFTPNRGFVIESQRGGSGYIKVIKMQNSNDNFLKNALDIVSKPINVTQAGQLIDELEARKILTQGEAGIVKSAVNLKALNNPFNMDNVMRANILKQIIIELMKREDKNEL